MNSYYVTMIEILAVLIAQIGFNYTRTMSNRHTVRDNAWGTVKYGVVVQVFWLASNFLGIKAMFEQNYIIVLFYLLGGAIGTYLAFKLDIDKGNKK